MLGGEIALARFLPIGYQDQGVFESEHNMRVVRWLLYCPSAASLALLSLAILHRIQIESSAYDARSPSVTAQGMFMAITLLGGTALSITLVVFLFRKSSLALPAAISLAIAFFSWVASIIIDPAFLFLT